MSQSHVLSSAQSCLSINSHPTNHSETFREHFLFTCIRVEALTDITVFLGTVLVHKVPTIESKSKREMYELFSEYDKYISIDSCKTHINWYMGGPY